MLYGTMVVSAVLAIWRDREEKGVLPLDVTRDRESLLSVLV